MPDFNTKQRAALSSKGQAMPGGGFPIRNGADLKRAIQAFGRAKNKPAAKAWIIKRAKALGLTKELPSDWLPGSAVQHEDAMNEGEAFLKHYGVPGMHWGKRNASSSSSSSDIRKIPRKNLDKNTPEHAKEIKRRNTRNDLITAGALLGAYAATQTAAYAIGKSYASKLAAQATEMNRIPDSKALHDGNTFVLRLLENGSFGK